jgi:hypothetical protein
LRFDKAEPVADAPGLACSSCRAPLIDEYWDVAGQPCCAGCREKVLALAAAPTKEDLLRALLYGAGAAIGGSVLWFAVSKITGLQVGYIAILVGAFVGRAVRRGASGKGGRSLQVLAVVLTYLSIVSSYVPDVLKGILEGAHQQQSKEPTARTSSAPAEGEKIAVPVGEPPAAAAAPVKHMHPLLAIAVLLGGALLVSCLAPFLSGFQNIIGLLIIGFALMQAWRVNRRGLVPIHGPLRLSAAPEPVPAAPLP